MLLSGEIAIIYGGGGAIGAASSRVFARERAKVFLAGRSQAKLAVVAQRSPLLVGWPRSRCSIASMPQRSNSTRTWLRRSVLRQNWIVPGERAILV